VRLPRKSEFAFASLRGTNYMPSSRSYLAGERVREAFRQGPAALVPLLVGART
jgi:hypothetical protein